MRQRRFSLLLVGWTCISQCWGGCLYLHLLVGEFMTACGAGLLVEILLWIHHLLWSVLVLVNAGVFGPHAAPHRPAQLWHTEAYTRHIQSRSSTCSLRVEVRVFWLKQETDLWPSCWSASVSAPLDYLPSPLWPPPEPPLNPTPPYISSPPGDPDT